MIGILACHTGDLSHAEKDLAPIRGFGRPIADVIMKKRYVQQSMLNGSQPKGMHYYWKSEFLPDLTDELLETSRQQGAAIASPISQIVIFQLGGVLADHGPADVPFGNRDACYAFFAAGGWRPDDPDGERHRAWARRAWESIRPHSTGSSHVNWQTADEDQARVQEAYGDNFERLTDIKAAYDPTTCSA